MTGSGLRGWVCTLFAGAVLAALVVALGLWLMAWRLPLEAPLARMYRTEADLAVLVRAVDTYRDALGEYPPAGVAGLELATKHLSQTADYFPGGPPSDGWGRPFRYVPHGQYLEADSGAQRVEGRFFAPDTYQLYSVGGDGASGLDDPAKRADTICNWDASRLWRPVYRRRNRRYLEERGEAP